MSPCTAKLNAFRNKQVGKYVLPTVESNARYWIYLLTVLSTQGQAQVPLRPSVI